MDIFPLVDELQTLARNGLAFASDPYDRERYERLLTLATQSYADLLDAPAQSIRPRFVQELGYITPKVGADAAIFNEDGHILLMERADGSGWCLPCGWVEPNEKPSQAVVREVWEETGLTVEVQGLVGHFTRLPSAVTGPHTMIAIVFLCAVTGGELTLSHEGLALAYRTIDDVQHWHATHERYARSAWGMWKAGGVGDVVWD